ncbi:putative replicative DNA helicase [Nostoc commune NIES-4072]|uniref:Putative replicative DNA helicase n=1 Tax=Nostoc commune NIES-4072 TaxID=2005467 RepID=A0A2R5FQU6_NOSCO|nr:DnaB-like helicase N-terminal domain-containing protein [Nostoc commune]BBD64483.1 putative replicative DNA helicase [Nostoc commune HK-02]GBG18191.1 putative replicative DNA helicase [Nostoc commune NIES-4072]
MINTFAPPTLSLSNVDVEITLLGAILLDPQVICNVAEVLPAEAFTVQSHQKIYQAAVSLYKQQQTVSSLTVTNWLLDRNLYKEVGGNNTLAMLVNNCVSCANADHYAEMLVEKHIRRQLVNLSTELDQKAHETEKPLAWILENIEQKMLKLTQLRNAKGTGYWQKIDDIAFERLCKELEDIEEVENAAQRDWLMRKLAKKWKFSSKKEILDFHAKWLDSQSKTQLYTAKEYFGKYGNREQDWVVPGLVPTESVVVAYGDGGVGKTRFAFTLAKYACSGGRFTYDGAEIEPMKVLLIETDQGARNTSKLLEMQDFFEDELTSDRLSICEEWTVGEFGKLKQMLKQNQPQLVIIDSLMSVSTSSIYSENDTEYARPIVRLRHLAQEFNCTFLLVHHCNANGEIRGTRAIKFSCDELWKLTRQRNEIEEFNALTIEKSRSRGPGAYKFMYDDETWGWKFTGRLEDSAISQGDNQSTNIMSRCIKYLKQHRGIPYEAQELAEELNLNRDTVRRDLKRGVNEGLVRVGRSQRDKRALVYYCGARKEVNRSDQPDQRSDQRLITFNALQGEGSGRCDQLINENLKFSIVKTEKIVDQFDQLITSTSNPVVAMNKTDQPELITSDELITSEPKIDPTVDQLSHSLTIEVNHSLTSESKNPQKTLSKQIHDQSPIVLPLIQEKATYWSASFKREVKVFQIFDAHSEASCQVPEKGRLSLRFTDLQYCEQSPRSDFNVGDKVEIQEGKYKETFATITTIRADGIWLKCDDRRKPLARAYFPHQLMKV